MPSLEQSRHRLRCITLDAEDLIRESNRHLSEADIHLESARLLNDAVEGILETKNRPSAELRF